MNSIEKNIKNITNNYYKYLMNLENVNGVAFGYKFINKINTFKPCIKVLVNKKVNKKYLSKNNIIPNIYMGIETDVIKFKETSLSMGYDISSLPKSAYSKIRPLQGGCSIGLTNDTGFGTICCIVKKNVTVTYKPTIISKPREKLKTFYYILSNNHVLAEEGTIPLGSNVFQPSPFFLENSKKNKVATLDTYIPLKSILSGPVEGGGLPFNLVDCAIARLNNSNLKSNKIFGLGKLKGVKTPKLGMKVKKVGAKTSLTLGEITGLHVTKFTNSIIGKQLFKDLILSNLVTEAGDSGSPVLTENNEIVAMHMSGINGDATANDINIVLKELNVDVYL